MSFFRKLFGRLIKKDIVVNKPIIKFNSLRIRHFKFKLASDPLKFGHLILEKQRCALILETTQYKWIASIVATIIDPINSQKELYRIFMGFPLICKECGFELPSHRVLQAIRSSQTKPLDIPMIVFGSPDPKLDRKARCPNCRSSQSILIFDYVGEVSSEDLANIRVYWKYLGDNFWESADRSSGICDSCCREDVSKGNSYYTSNRVICEGCCDEILSESTLEKLREDPDYIGMGTIQKARLYKARITI